MRGEVGFSPAYAATAPIPVSSEQTASYLHNAAIALRIRRSIQEAKTSEFLGNFAGLSPQFASPTPSIIAPQKAHFPSLTCQCRTENPNLPMTNSPQAGQ